MNNKNKQQPQQWNKNETFFDFYFLFCFIFAWAKRQNRQNVLSTQVGGNVFEIRINRRLQVSCDSDSSLSSQNRRITCERSIWIERFPLIVPFASPPTRSSCGVASHTVFATHQTITITDDDSNSKTNREMPNIRK